MNIYNNGTVAYTVGDIDRLAAERDAALAQNAELVAMVAALREAAQPAIVYLTYTAKRSAGAERALTSLARALQSTPTQHLRDIQADAIEQAVLATKTAMHEGGQEWLCRADSLRQHAARVKAGEV